MKYLKKLLAAVMTMFLTLTMSTVALAQTVGEPKTTSITVNNAAKGEYYAVYKVLDATIASGGKIAYTGEIPSEFASVLDPTPITVGANTYSAINAKPGITNDSEALKTAAKNYVARIAGVAYEDLVKGNTFPNAALSAQADGDGKIIFNLDPGYYIVVSTQGTNVIVDSATNPAATINEKNSTTIQVVEKKADKESYSIGDTITYTAKFNTANYYEGNIVTNYEIQDTLPDFLSNVKVTSVTVGGVALDPTPKFENKKFDIAWVNETAAPYTSKYNNGVQIVVTYTAELTSVANINTANTNTISLHPTVWNGTNNETPWDVTWQKDAVIKTYAAALKKVDGSNNALPGAKFTIKGLTVDGTNGIYTVESYNPNGAESDQLDTDANGNLYIVGLAEGVSLTVTEAVAPNGYNKMTSTVEVPAQKLSEELHKESGVIHYDAKGNVIGAESTSGTTGTNVDQNLNILDPQSVKIVNNQGTELPSTGGIGTTIFYIVGGVMVAGAAIFLLTKRRMSGNAQ